MAILNIPFSKSYKLYYGHSLGSPGSGELVSASKFQPSWDTGRSAFKVDMTPILKKRVLSASIDIYIWQPMSTSGIAPATFEFQLGYQKKEREALDIGGSGELCPTYNFNQLAYLDRIPARGTTQDDVSYAITIQVSNDVIRSIPREYWTGDLGFGNVYLLVTAMPHVGAGVPLQIYSTVSTTYKPIFRANFNDSAWPSDPPTNLSPNTTSPYYGELLLTWQYNPQPELIIVDPQTKSEVRARKPEGAWITDTRTNAPFNVTELSILDFGLGSIIEWQVRTETESNGFSEWSELASFEFKGAPPKPPILIYPKGSVLIMGGNIRFEWLYQSAYDTAANKYDFAYSLNGGEETVLETVTPSAVIELTDGVRVDWRVRAYNSIDIVGEWSERETFFIAGAPQAPNIISVTNSARPMIFWGAEDSSVWQLQICQVLDVLHDTGETLYTGTESYKAPLFLEDGVYIVKIRVKNQHGFHSEWAVREFRIITAKPERPTITVADNDDSGVYLNCSGYTEGIIYRSEAGREFIPIQKVDVGYFVDYTVISGVEYRYFLRSIETIKGDTETFIDSDTKSIIVEFSYTTIAEAGNASNYLQLWLNYNDRVRREISIVKNKTAIQFLGRDYPGFETDTFKQKSIKFGFYTKDYSMLEKITNSSAVLLLRDAVEGKAYGTISAMTANRTIEGYAVSFTFIYSDFREGIDIS